MRRFDTGAGMFRAAETPQDKRLAVRIWLTDVLQWVQKEGEDTGPAFALLGALEGLDFGHVDPMLRLPAGQRAGGKEPPAGETGIKAFALAAVDTLKSSGMQVQIALHMVGKDLGLEPQALENLRKKMSVERSKPANEQRLHSGLIEAYEAEMLRMKGMSKEAVWVDLAQISDLMGLR